MEVLLGDLLRERDLSVLRLRLRQALEAIGQLLHQEVARDVDEFDPQIGQRHLVVDGHHAAA